MHEINELSLILSFEQSVPQRSSNFDLLRTTTSVWEKRLVNWGGHGVLTTASPRNDLDMEFVHMGEEGVHVRIVGEILD